MKRISDAVEEKSKELICFPLFNREIDMNFNIQTDVYNYMCALLSFPISEVLNCQKLENKTKQKTIQLLKFI